MRTSEYSSSFDYTTISESQSFNDLSSLADVPQSVLSYRHSFFSPLEFTRLTEAINRSVHLASLQVTHSNVAKCGFQTLCRCFHASLTHIDLSWNCLTDQEIECFAAALVACPNIDKVRLAHNRITDVGVRCLSRQFPLCPHISVLDLESNRISHSFDVSPLDHLQDLNVTGNLLSEQAWEEMLGQLAGKRMRSVRVAGVEITESVSEAIETIINKNAEAIDVCDLHEVHISSPFRCVSSLTKCSSFTLSNTPVPEYRFTQQVGLTYLNLSYSSLSVPAFSSLTERFFDVNQSLKSLILSGNILSQDSSTLLSRNLPYLSALTRLELASMCLHSHTFLVLLQGVRLKKLKVLNLSDDLPTRDESGTVERNIAEAVLYCDHLNSLDVSDNQLESVGDLSTAFARLESLNLERTRLRAEEETNTLEVLSACRELQWLNLSGQQLVSEEQQGFSFRLSAVLLSNCELTSQTLSRFLCSSLREINLSGTHLSHTLVSTLFRCVDPSIESLNLAYSSCGDVGCRCLADRALVLTKVRTVSLGHCGVTSVGAELVLGGVAGMGNLRSLDLSGNRIDRVDVTAVGFMGTSLLAFLDLRRNPLPSPQALAPDFLLKFPSLIDFLY